MAKALEHKRYLVLGLGAFGLPLAEQLTTNGQKVTGVDISEPVVERVKDTLYEAVVADATDRDVLADLRVDQVDTVVVSLGAVMQRSILASLHARELGAQQIMVEGIDEDHRKILQCVGVTEVIFPETAMARQIADRLSWPNMLDRLAMDDQYSMAEIEIPKKFIGKTLANSNLRRDYGIEVIAVREAESSTVRPVPQPDESLNEGETLVVIGSNEAIAKFQEEY